VEKGSLIRR